MEAAYQILLAVLLGANVHFLASTQEQAEVMLKEAQLRYSFLMEILRN